MKYHILSKEIYEEKLADLLQRREGSSNTIYMDGNGLPTIGIGYALMFANHEPRNIEEIKADMKNAMDPTHYADINWKKVESLLENIKDSFKKGYDPVAIQTKINNYYKNNDKGTLRLTKEEEKTLLTNVVLPKFEKQLDNALTKHLPYSTERVATISQIYRLGIHGAPSMIKAINEGNRAEAWYQIRYNSNGDNLKGNYDRVIEESDLFCLHDKYPNAKNEKDIKDMFSDPDHASKIEKEEKKSPLYQKSNEEHHYNLYSLSHIKGKETSQTNQPYTSSLLSSDEMIPNAQIADFDTNENKDDLANTEALAYVPGIMMFPTTIDAKDIVLASDTSNKNDVDNGMGM